MNRATALRELLAKVEAGDDTWMNFADREFPDEEWDRWIWKAKDAYQGSLDAARSLHEAVLPGWEWRIYLDRFSTVEKAHTGNWVGVCSGMPSRAWLIAILRALLAETGEEG